MKFIILTVLGLVNQVSSLTLRAQDHQNGQEDQLDQLDQLDQFRKETEAEKERLKKQLE